MTLAEALKKCYGTDDAADYMVYPENDNAFGISWGPFHGREAAARFMNQGPDYASQFAVQCGTPLQQDLEARLANMAYR